MDTPLVEDLSGDLQRFFLRGSLSTDDVTQIASLCHYQRFAPGETILAEGATNNHLFFIVQGEVRVVRQGETITTLGNPGDVLGEMSLVTQKVCSASNIAMDSCALLVIDIGKVHLLPARLQELFTSAMNRLFSIILAKKLALTNEKARLFEITNRELQVAKKALEAASANRIDEMTGNQSALIRKLSGIFKDAIEPIKNELELQAALSKDKKLTELSALAQRAYLEIEPITKTMAAEGALKNKRVLLVEDDANEQINAKMSLGGTGLDFKVVGDLESAKAILNNSQENKFDIVCVNNHFVELIPLVQAQNKATKFVFITSDPVSKHFQTLNEHPELSTILARHPNDRTFTVKNTATTIRKLLSGDIFGTEKYLSWGTDVIEHPITSSDQRSELIGKFEGYIEELGVRGGLKNKATRVAEELLMNAIYDAPHDAQGKALYNHLTRDNPVHLKREEYGRFRYACDGTFLAISTVDPFGALPRSTILTYLKRCLSDGIGEGGGEGKGGGGNGLFQIIQSSSLTVFNVQPKKRTEVIALLNLNFQMQKISLNPSFHFFETFN